MIHGRARRGTAASRARPVPLIMSVLRGVWTPMTTEDPKPEESQSERIDQLITTTPPIDENAAVSSTPLYFPHLADSGGYTTQFILFNTSAGSTAAGTLRLVSPNGTALSLVIR